MTDKPKICGAYLPMLAKSCSLSEGHKEYHRFDGDPWSHKTESDDKNKTVEKSVSLQLPATGDGMEECGTYSPLRGEHCVQFRGHEGVCVFNSQVRAAGDPYAIQRIPRNTEPPLRFYTQEQLDTYVSSAVQEAIKEQRAKYEWLCKNVDEVHSLDDGTFGFYPNEMPPEGRPYQYYPSVDALVSSEREQERT